MADDGNDDATVEALTRLARALDTSVDDLLLRAPASWAEDPRPFEDGQVLGSGQCRRLLESEGIGRVGFGGTGGPLVLPVNYVFSNDRVIFRTSRRSPLRALDGLRVVFEIDGVDRENRTGWSVLVSGVARTVHEPLDGLPCGAPESWAGPDRDVYVVIDADRITGRQVRADDARRS
jgi:hypothetical protein